MAANSPANALPVRYRLDEYIIERVLGVGGFGITYLAADSRLSARVAIKEYFPQAYSHRDRTQTIHPNSTGNNGDAENYLWGLQEFLKEARALAKFKHPNIVRVLRFLEANGTAYMVMEYEEGESLSDHVNRQGGYLAEPTLLNIFLPILTGLQAVHDAGLLHLDIKPDNIYLRRNGQPMLIDFGAARQRQGSSRSEKVALTPGYCAPEQYPGHGDLGSWSDVYSMGATLYRCVTGKEPTDSRDRLNGLKKLRVDPLIPATRFERPHYSAHIRTCVDTATALKPDDRPRSAFALQNGLMGKSMDEKPKAVADNAYSRGAGFVGIVNVQDDDAKKPKGRWRSPAERMLVLIVFVAVLLVAPVYYMVGTGAISEGEVYDYVDRVKQVTIGNARLATRYVEENVFGVTRPPDYVSPAATVVARKRPRAAEVSVVPFNPEKGPNSRQVLASTATSVAFVNDGDQLAIAMDNGRVELRNAETGKLVGTFSPANGERAVAAVSADGQRLAFSIAGHSIQIWDTRKVAFVVELEGHLEPVIALAFSPDGTRLASVGKDQSTLIWNSETGALVQDLSRAKIEPLAIAFSPDGRRLAIGDSAGGIRYVRLDTMRDLAYVPTRDQPISALTYSPDGKWFAVASEQGYLGLWDVSGKHADRVLELAPDIVHDLAFSPDSKWLLVAGSDRSVQLWNVESGRFDRRYTGDNLQTYSLALAPEGRRIAAAGGDRALTLWR